MCVSAVFKRIKVVTDNLIILLLRQPKVIVICFKQSVTFRELDEIRRCILIKVPDVILEELAPVNDISQISALLRNGDTQRIFQSQRGSHGMRGGTNPADSLRKIHSVEGASSLQHFFKAPEKQAFCPCIRHNAVIYVSVYLHKPTDSGDWVDDNSLRFVHLLRCTITDERLHFVGEPKHGAADTGTVVADGPIHAIVPFPDRAVDSCDRSSASKLEHAGFLSQL